MSDFITAAEEVRKMLRGFKAVEVVSAALEKVGSIENASKEAEAKLDSLKGLIAAASNDLDSGVAAISEAKEQAKKIAIDAKAKAESRVAKAQEEAASVMESAKAIADEHLAKVETLASEIAEKVSVKDAVSAELADIEAKISKAKAYLAKLAGG